jgi:geranylgeranyl diphosphate synthase type II
MFEATYQGYLQTIERGLDSFFPELPSQDGGAVTKAARYSLLAGGKRIRPVLLLSTLDSLGQDSIGALPFACALEMIHTYSLIHDDLPCMDDDDFRRGRPTCHRQFGEALAVLAGDALLNRAYEILLAALPASGPGGIRAAQILAEAAGAAGMIGGQTLDLEAEGKVIDAEALWHLHSLKTGQLIQAPVRAACVLAGARPDLSVPLERFAAKLGLAFQIQDDILDVTASAEKLGKSTGKDARDQKSTSCTILGLDAARNVLEEETARAIASLEEAGQAGCDIRFLTDLTTFLLKRDH